MSKWTQADIDAITKMKQQWKTSVPKRSKYGAIKTTVDGIVFDSKKEAQRYAELKLMEKAGHITALRVHPSFPLCVYPRTDLGHLGRPVDIGAYEPDFAYERDGHTVIEDVKGMAGLPLFRWKAKHLEAQYGLKVHEIR